MPVIQLWLPLMEINKISWIIFELFSLCIYLGACVHVWAYFAWDQQSKVPNCSKTSRWNVFGKRDENMHTMTKKFCWDKIPFFFNVNRMSIAITGHKNYLHGHVNVRGLGGCGHFSTIFVSFKGRARYKDVGKTQILELDNKWNFKVDLMVTSLTIQPPQNACYIARLILLTLSWPFTRYSIWLSNTSPCSLMDHSLLTRLST